MFELDPHSSYLMPAHFGPRPLSPKASGWYRNVTSMTVAFLTDREKLAAYLPEPWEVAEERVSQRARPQDLEVAKGREEGRFRVLERLGQPPS